MSLKSKRFKGAGAAVSPTRSRRSRLHHYVFPLCFAIVASGRTSSRKLDFIKKKKRGGLQRAEGSLSFPPVCSVAT